MIKNNMMLLVLIRTAGLQAEQDVEDEAAATVKGPANDDTIPVNRFLQGHDCTHVAPKDASVAPSSVYYLGHDVRM